MTTQIVSSRSKRFRVGFIIFKKYLKFQPCSGSVRLLLKVSNLGYSNCYCLHRQSLCDIMNSLFFQPKSQILVFILINNQLLSTANAKDINTDYD